VIGTLRAVAPLRDGLVVPEELDAAEIAAFFAKDEQADNYYGITSIPHDRPPAEALRLTTELADRAPTDDALCWLGVALLEPLIELHWRALGESLDRALIRSGNLRKALSCVWLSDVADELETRWYSLIQPDEHVGRRRSD
jgi:hypothetical protein